LRRVAQFLLLAVAAQAQDPLRTLPRNYQLTFENDLVRVIRVHYDAGEKLPVHDHPKTPTIYVYLSDAGPVRFKHAGSEPFDLQRPAVRRGGFRLSPGFVETHAVENVSDQPNDFLRVELKTLPIVRTSSLHGRFPPPTDYAYNATKVEFENANVRIVRFVCGAQVDCEIGSTPDPALEVLFSRSDTGQVRWTPVGSRPASEKAMHLLRIEFKKRA
jgi:hypothetical protein